MSFCKISWWSLLWWSILLSFLTLRDQSRVNNRESLKCGFNKKHQPISTRGTLSPPDTPHSIWLPGNHKIMYRQQWLMPEHFMWEWRAKLAISNTSIVIVMSELAACHISLEASSENEVKAHDDSCLRWSPGFRF